MILSAPSFLIPGTYLENVRYIDTIPEVKCIELLFFTFDDDSWNIFQCERKEIQRYVGRFDFSVHMPDPILPEHETLIEGTKDFVSHYIVHPDFKKPEFFTDLVGKWSGIYGNIFYIENTLAGTIESMPRLPPDLPLCLDTGHLLLQKKSPAGYFNARESRIKKIHLHGTIGEKDHQAVTAEEPWVKEFSVCLKKFSGMVHIEIFNSGGYLRVLENLRRYGIV